MAYTPDPFAWRGPVEKSPTLAGTGAQSSNLFTVTGSCELVVKGQVTTPATNMTVLQLTEHDGTAAVDISASGVTLTALAAGTMLFRTGLAAAALALADNAAGAVTDSAAAHGQSGILLPFAITKKTAVATYVRMTYSTTSNPDPCVILWTCFWRPLSSDGAVVAS